MIATSGIVVPQVSLRDASSLGAVQRLAWAMGRPPAAPAPGVSGRRQQAVAALRRLADDPRATPAERILAAERASRLLRRRA